MIRNLVNDLKESSIFSDEQVSKLSESITTCFQEQNDQSLSNLESILSVISKKIDSDPSRNGAIALVRSKSFAKCLVVLFEEFAKGHGILSEQFGSKTFLSHSVYELALYITLGLVEKTLTLKPLMESLDDELIKLLIFSLGSIISSDTYYLSQVSRSFSYFQCQLFNSS
jgi:hypothetical protein